MKRVTRRLTIVPGVLLIALTLAHSLRGDERGSAWDKIAPHFQPPVEFANQRGKYR